MQVQIVKQKAQQPRHRLAGKPLSLKLTRKGIANQRLLMIISLDVKSAVADQPRLAQALDGHLRPVAGCSGHVALHFLQRQPTPVPQPPTLNFLSTATHKLLLLAILIQFISGPLAIWSGGRDINVFDLFAIPTPFATENEAVHEGAEVAHAIGRWMLLGLIVLHALGALKHVFIDRDGVLRRMLAPAKN